MKLWLQLALRNVFRNFRRSLLTAGTIMAGTALVTFSLAWIAGIFGEMISGYTAAGGHIRIVTSAFSKRELLAPLYENIPNADQQLAHIRQQPGVQQVAVRISTGALVSAGEEIGDNFAAILGADEGYYQNAMKIGSRIQSGTWLTGAGREAVVGRRVAKNLNIAPGATLLLMGQTQDGSMSSLSVKVTGIAGGDGLLDGQILLSLEDVRYLADMPGAALELLVWADAREREVIDPIVRSMRADPELQGLTIQPWYEREPLASSLPMLDGVNSFIQMLIGFVAALAIFNTMSMSVLERTTEIGVLRAMGLTRIGAVGLFVLEGAFIGVIGGLAGALVGAVPSWYLEKYGVSLPEQMLEKVGNLPLQARVYANLSSEIVIQAILLGVSIAVVGAFLPSLRAAAIRPVTAMRARR